MKEKTAAPQRQLHLRLVSGRPLPAPTVPRWAPDDHLEFLLAESLKAVERDGCICYVKAREGGRRHNKRTCKCVCKHKRKGSRR